jgi:hypothetical protein
MANNFVLGPIPVADSFKVDCARRSKHGGHVRPVVEVEAKAGDGRGRVHVGQVQPDAEAGRYKTQFETIRVANGNSSNVGRD